MIKEKLGDITTVRQGVIMHGVNCQGAMGAGVALAIRNKWPAVYDSYRRAVIGYRDSKYTSLRDLLGNCDIVRIEDGLFVANLFTQLNYGRLPVRYVSYDAIDSATRSLSRQLKEINELSYRVDFTIHMPLIGAGLANGNWNIIREIVDANLPDETYTKYLWRA